MAIYCYVTDDGERSEQSFPMGEAPQTVKVNGKTAYRDYRAEMSGVGSHGDHPGWPIASESMGVHPSQRAEAIEHDKKLGVKTDYTHDGRPVFESRGHQRRWLHAHKGINRDDY